MVVMGDSFTTIDQRVLEWLDSLDSKQSQCDTSARLGLSGRRHDDDDDDYRPRKRRRDQTRPLPSPSVTTIFRSMAHPRATPGDPGAGAREGEGLEGPDDLATPRPHRQLADLASRPSISSRTSSKRSASSSISRTSSPTKQLRMAALDDTGFVLDKFEVNHDNLPPSLRSLLGELEKIENGTQFLSSDLISEVSTLTIRSFPSDCVAIHFADRGHGVEQLQPFNIPTHAFRPPDQSETYPTEPRCCSLAAFVRQVRSRAAECDNDGEPERVWNDDVHLRILNWVYRPSGEATGLVDFRSWYAPTNA